MYCENKFANEPRNVELREWCNANRGRTTHLLSHVPGYKKGAKNQSFVSDLKHGVYKITDKMWDKIKIGMTNVENYEKTMGIKTLNPIETKSSFKHIPQITKLTPKYIKQREEVREKFIKEIIANMSMFQKFTSETLKYQHIQTVNDVKKLSNIDFRSLVLHYRVFSRYDTTSSSTLKDICQQWMSTGDYEQKRRLFNVAYNLNFGRKKDINSSTLSRFLNGDHRLHYAKTIENVKATIKKVDSMIAENHPFALAAKQ